MQSQSRKFLPTGYPAFLFKNSYVQLSKALPNNWEKFQMQLIQQWPKINEGELELAGQNRKQIALLIQSKYGIDATLVEIYLRNFERTITKRLAYAILAQNGMTGSPPHREN